MVRAWICSIEGIYIFRDPCDSRSTLYRIRIVLPKYKHQEQEYSPQGMDGMSRQYYLGRVRALDEPGPLHVTGGHHLGHLLALTACQLNCFPAKKHQRLIPHDRPNIARVLCSALETEQSQLGLQQTIWLTGSSSTWRLSMMRCFSVATTRSKMLLTGRI
jgi:hypothetical protein